MCQWQSTTESTSYSMTVYVSQRTLKDLFNPALNHLTAFSHQTMRIPIVDNGISSSSLYCYTLNFASEADRLTALYMKQDRWQWLYPLQQFVYGAYHALQVAATKQQQQN